MIIHEEDEFLHLRVWVDTERGAPAAYVSDEYGRFRPITLYDDGARHCRDKAKEGGLMRIRKLLREIDWPMTICILNSETELPGICSTKEYTPLSELDCSDQCKSIIADIRNLCEQKYIEVFYMGYAPGVNLAREFLRDLAAFTPPNF